MNVWLTSDLHLFHENLLRGRKIGIRPFDTLNEMHDAIITGWNSVVKPSDKVYMLGDLTLERGENFEPTARVVAELQGQKRMLLGNHDHFLASTYHAMGFEKILATRVLDRYVLSHIPIHPSQFARYKGSVHGHLHEAVVTEDYIDRYGAERRVPDNRYINVCVEQTNFIPVNLDAIRRNA